MKYDPHCYPNHLWGIPPAEEGEHTLPFAAPFMAQRQHKRVRAQALVGVERRAQRSAKKHSVLCCWKSQQPPALF